MTENLKGKVFFVKAGRRIPFYEFLREEKERRSTEAESRGERFTWVDMGTFCGVNRVTAYVMNTSNGSPNHPPIEKFEKIIAALGFTEEDFEIDKSLRSHRSVVPKIGSAEYVQTLRQIGDELLRINTEEQRRQRLSSTFIRRTAGENFYSIHASSFPERARIHQEILDLDPKYRPIRLQHQIQNKTGWKPLEILPGGVSEEDIISFAVLEYVEKHTSGDEDRKRLPGGIYDFVLERLNTERKARELGNRSRSSIVHHVQKIWYARDSHSGEEFTRDSPEPSKAPARRIIDTGLEDITEEPEEEIGDLVDLPTSEERKENYFRHSCYGHEALIAYLMDPENYKPLLGQDVKLIAVDFNEDTIPEGLEEFFEPCKLDLEGRLSEEDREATEFIDHWLRCDMIFKRREGGYVVVEVKQNAVDTKSFRNAQKAGQQVAAYTAVILDNVQLRNNTHQGNGEYEPIKEQVEGYVAAYTIQDSLEKHLRRIPNRGAIAIDKATVDEYIAKAKSQEVA